MFDHETFRNLNDELKYELYKDLNENVTYFKRIIENLTVSTKDEEKKNKFIDLENFKNTGNSKIAENKFENEWSKIETRSRNQNKRTENIQESKNKTKKSKYKQPIFKKKNSTNNENIYFYHEKENILAYYWETQLLTESLKNKYRKMCWRVDLVGTKFLHCWKA